MSAFAANQGELNRAWKFGRNARIRGLDIKATNVELARQFGWRTAKDFDNALLDECERGWNHEDELRFRD
jgi:hypothetical protein